MKRFVVTVACLISSTAAMAQQSQSTSMDRVSIALGQCIGTLEKHIDQVHDLQKKLAEAEAKIKKLEEEKPRKE